MKGRHGAVFIPIAWHRVPWRGRRYADLAAAKSWCREHAGVERADWEYSHGRGYFRFRDPDTAALFNLTWG